MTSRATPPRLAFATFIPHVAPRMHAARLDEHTGEHRLRLNHE